MIDNAPGFLNSKSWLLGLFIAKVDFHTKARWFTLLAFCVVNLAIITSPLCSESIKHYWSSVWWLCQSWLALCAVNPSNITGPLCGKSVKHYWLFVQWIHQALLALFVVNSLMITSPLCSESIKHHWPFVWGIRLIGGFPTQRASNA